MNKDFPYLDIPEKLKPVIGEPDDETRIYRREGNEEEGGPWFEAISEHFPGVGFVSPGGVGMFAPVSRAGVYKRLREGKLTAFCFHVVEAKQTLFSYQKKVKQRPYMYIPVSECKAWGEELRARPDRKAAYVVPGAGSADLESEVLDAPKKGAAAVKMPEIMQMVRQALKEVLAEDFPTFMGAKARREVAAKTRAKLDGRNKNAK